MSSQDQETHDHVTVASMCWGNTVSTHIVRKSAHVSPIAGNKKLLGWRPSLLGTSNEVYCPVGGFEAHLFFEILGAHHLQVVAQGVPWCIPKAV